MRFSARVEMAVRCASQLARNRALAPISSREVARREGLTTEHAAKILVDLKQAGVVRATRGASGGYALSGSPQDVTLGDVVAALGEPLFSSDYCHRQQNRNGKCLHLRDCTLRAVLLSVNEAARNVLSGIRLADLEGSEAEMAGRLEIRS